MQQSGHAKSQVIYDSRNYLSPIHSTFFSMTSLADKMMFKLPDFMAPSGNKKSDSQRPRPLHVSRSFSKPEPASPDISTRVQRASTIQNGVDLQGKMSSKPAQDQRSSQRQADAFEKSSEDEEDQGQTGGASEKLPSDFDELPIELISLTDRSVLKQISLCYNF